MSVLPLRSPCYLTYSLPDGLQRNGQYRAALFGNGSRPLSGYSNLIYLNHAAVAPLVRPAAEAMKQLAADACEFGSLHYGDWLEAYESLRVAAARLIGADRGEIAIVKNTSEGIATVAIGAGLAAGRPHRGFPRGVPGQLLSMASPGGPGRSAGMAFDHGPVEAIERACRGARLLAISYVNYLSGHRVDLHAIGEICRRQMPLLCGCHSGAGRIPGRCAIGRHPCAGGGRAQMAAGTRKAAESCMCSRICRTRSSQSNSAGPTRQLRRLRLSGHDAPARCRAL